MDKDNLKEEFYNRKDEINSRINVKNVALVTAGLCVVIIVLKRKKGPKPEDLSKVATIFNDVYGPGEGNWLREQRILGRATMLLQDNKYLSLPTGLKVVTVSGR